MHAWSALGLLLFVASPASAANLDVTSSYRMRAVSYRNLSLNSDPNYHTHQSFIHSDARLGMAVRRIFLENRGGEDVTMDVAVAFRALGVTGSSTAVRGAPLDRAGSYYPGENFTPFIENAFIRVHNFWGKPVEVTFGRQSFRLGSGLLLDDDGAGLTGVSARGQLPWWGMKLEGFVFADRNPNFPGAGGTLALYGLSLDLPTEGNWQLNQLFERDRTNQSVFGCRYETPANTGFCQASMAKRRFTSLRYQLNYGPMVFDGEAAYQGGSAVPTGPVAPPGKIGYEANAQVIKAKWKQSLYKLGEGIARMSVARGSGDDPGTPSRDEAFYPSHGHRFNGLERSGFGEFYNATPYDAYGGNYSTSSISGLDRKASGIQVVGVGFTPPAWKGVALDVDYFLFQAERVQSGKRTLGREWDLKLRYNVEDRFALALTAAFFSAGAASPGPGSKARKYALDVFARF